MLANREGHQFCLVFGRQTGETYQHNAACVETLTTDNLSDILVRSEQEGRFMVSQSKHLAVGYARLGLGYIDDAVAISAEALNDLAVHTLVGEQIHFAASARG